MSTAALIMLFLEILKQRADAGFPILKRLIEKWAKNVQDQADSLDSGVITFGDAPADLLTLVVETLTKLREGTDRLAMKMFYTLLINFAPLVINQLWDKLFEMKQVATPSTVQLSADISEDDLKEFFDI